MASRLDVRPPDEAGQNQSHDDFDSIVANSLSDVGQNSASPAPSAARQSTPALSKNNRYGSKMRRRNPLERRGSDTPQINLNAPISPGSLANQESEPDNSYSEPYPQQTEEPQTLAPAAIRPEDDDAEEAYDTVGAAYASMVDPFDTVGALESQDTDTDPDERDIARRERSAKTDDANGNTKPTNAEQERFAEQPNDTIGGGYIPNTPGVGGAAGMALKVVGKIRGGNRRRQALIGGGVSGVVLSVVLISFFTASLGMQHVRENLLNHGNRLTEYVTMRRRARSMTRLVKKMNTQTPLRKAINSDKFASKLAAQGFIVETLDDGSLHKLAWRLEDGSERVFDFNKSTTAASKEFFAGAEGRKMFRNLDKATSSRWSLYRGLRGRALFGTLGVRLQNMFDNAKPKPDADKTADEFGDKMSSAFEAADGNGLQPESRIPGADPESLKDPDDPNTKETRSALDQLTEGVDPEDKKKILTSSAADSTDELLTETVDKLTKDPAKLTKALVEETGSDLAKRLPKKLLSKAVSILSILGPVQTGCQLKGTLNFIANMRNIIFAQELSRFAVKWFTVADHQKAGLLGSEEVGLMMTYMSYPNPQNGKTAFNAGGLLRKTGQQPGADINPVNFAKVNGARIQGGLFAPMVSFMNNSVGQVLTPGVCKFANNGFVVVGGAAVAVVFAIFGGAETGITQAQIILSTTLAVLTEVAFIVATPMFVKAGARKVLTGYEKNGEFVGDVLAAGSGSFFAQNANTNGLRLATRQKVAAIRSEADLDYREYIADQSIYDRYFNLAKADSLFGTMLGRAPFTYQAAMNTLGFSAPRYVSMGGMLSSVFGSIVPTSKVSAQDNTNQCNEDPQIKKFDIAVDDMCFPIVVGDPETDIEETEKILLDNGKIDAQGNPIGDDFKKYLEECHSGRTGLLYRANVSQDGNNSPEVNDCILEGDPLPGSSRGKFALYADHFAVNIVDAENIAEDINDDYQPVGGGQATNAPTNDSTTPGDVSYAEDTTNIPCSPLTTTIGPTNGYSAGQPVRINLCAVGTNIQVNSQISERVALIIRDAAAAGHDMATASQSFRTMEQQEYFYNCYITQSCNNGNKAAKPGFSNHQLGMAIDFACGDGSSACFDWLEQNQEKYKMYAKVSGEPWHWSVTGN